MIDPLGDENSLMETTGETETETLHTFLLEKHCVQPHLSEPRYSKL